jgi:hypothetical protein
MLQETESNTVALPYCIFRSSIVMAEFCDIEIGVGLCGNVYGTTIIVTS